jgi:putative ABC transport system permease protein
MKKEYVTKNSRASRPHPSLFRRGPGGSLKQIVKIIWTQRASNAWIWAEMLLVSIFLWYIVDTIYVRLWTYLTPTGFDIAHTYLLDIRAVSDDSYQYIPRDRWTTTTGDDLLTVLDRIRACPGVEAVSLSEASNPYNHNDGSNMITRDSIGLTAQHRMVTPDIFRVFRIGAAEGETARLVENLTFDRLVIASDVARVLYPEGNATGKAIGINYHLTDDSITYRVGAVCTPLRFDDFRRANPSFFLLFPEAFLQENLEEPMLSYMEICLRVTPEADHDFAARFRKDMAAQLRYNNLYLLNVRHFADVRERFIRNRMNDFKMSLAVAAFLLVNIFLGVVGTFWFRTRQRQGEMGLRIALGATGRGLQAMLMLEGIVLLLFAFVPAVLVGLNVCLTDLMETELMPFTAARFVLAQAASFILTAGMISFGVFYPAAQISRLQPAEALRYE